jgi:L-lactate permease
MPAQMVAGAAGAGIVYGIVRIAWTLLAAIFVYEITVETGHFGTIKESIGGITGWPFSFEFGNRNASGATRKIRP